MSADVHKVLQARTVLLRLTNAFRTHVAMVLLVGTRPMGMIVNVQRAGMEP